MRVLNKYLYPIGFAMMLFSSSAMAKIHPTAFKDITPFFLKGMEFYSPTLGEVALESGLIEGLRFYGPYEAGYDDKGRRVYLNDKSSDPLWNVVNILFPSNNGQLGTETTGMSNLPKNVKNPKTIALLMHYAKLVLEASPENFEKIDTKKIAKEIFESLKHEDKSPSSALKRPIDNLLGFIKDAILEEGKSIYPTHTTEQVLSAFFCYQFNESDEILGLLEDLDGSIVDKTKQPPSTLEPLKEEDFTKIAQKETYTIDDVFDLSLAASWSSLVPYKEGIALLNNGNALRYNREKDEYLKEDTFADCVETAARHLANLLTFNSEKQIFDVDHIEKNVPHTPYLENFIKFFKVQTPFLANAGDIGTRSLWNKALADLNEPGKKDITYKKGGVNELRSGFVNLLKAYQKVLGLKLEEFPQIGLEAKKNWAEKSLNILFKTLNPSYDYNINLKVKESENDLSGDALVTVQDSEEDIFSFNLMSDREGAHTEVSQLKILKEHKNKIDVNPYLINHLTNLQGGTSDESVWLVAPSDFKSNIHHPLYKLFSQPLSDNNSKINFLKTLDKSYGEWAQKYPSFKTNLSLIQSMIKNVLEDISWDDRAIVERVSPIIFKLIENSSFQDVVLKAVRGISIESENFDEILRQIRQFRNLESLDIPHVKEIRSFSDSFKNIKNLSSRFKGLQKIEIDESIAQLEVLDLNKSSLNKVSFSVPMPKLRFLTMESSRIERLENLKNISNVEEIKLFDTKELLEFSIPESFEKLTSLDLSSSGIETLEGLENAPNLEELDLRETELLKNLSFDKPLNKLRVLNLRKSKISVIEGLDHLCNLEEFYLTETKKIKEISFRTSFKKLQELNLRDSGIEIFSGLENTPNLRNLNLETTKSLKEISFDKCQENLENLILTGSGIFTIKGLEYLSNIEQLNLKRTENLTEVALIKKLLKIQSFNLISSGVSKLTGLENLPNVKKLPDYSVS